MKEKGWSDVLLRWYDRARRNLPWRLARPDPYKTWLSEIMLQQTQVDTVIPYFEKFLGRFPTVRALAAAPVEEVLAMWSGLGYYSRARNLHAAAQIIANNGSGGKKGTFPSTMAEWLELPGIGRYTAGAVASIAFGEKVPVVDGNVIRVLARLFALKGDPKKNPLHSKLWKLAATLLPEKRIGDFNQALMELGALVCTPENPKCGACPLQKNCRAFSLERVAGFPTSQPKAKTVRVLIEVALIEKSGKYLMAKRNGARHLQSMWEFPQRQVEGLVLKSAGLLKEVKHSIMNRRIFARPHHYYYEGGAPRKDRHYVGYRWVRPEGLGQLATSSLNLKIMKGVFQ